VSFAHPLLAWLLPALVAIAALARWWWGRRLARRMASAGVGVPHLTLAVGRRRERLRALMLWLGLALVAIAATGPRWGATPEIRRQTGADLLLLLDCSRSMLATDLYPTRIEAARRKAIDLVTIAPETRMALMPFAAVPVLRCPLTGDHDALSRMLQDCSPDLFPAEQGYQGTAIGDSVQEALRVLAHASERGQAVLVMSDGSDEDRESVKRAAREAREAGVIVFGLFLGDAESKATIDIDGVPHEMTANRATLDELAGATGGACVNATADDADVRTLLSRIQATVAQRPWEARALTVASERYLWPLLPGMALIALGALLPSRRRSRVGAAGMPTRMVA
jgi:Ca-activated chloride channel family protein